jgi:hypothetical protein
VLVIRGEAGIGNTALLADARERAVDMHVLAASGVESESELPFAALHQLVRPALGHVDRLPAESGYTRAFVMGAVGACVTLVTARFMPGRPEPVAARA